MSKRFARKSTFKMSLKVVGAGWMEARMRCGRRTLTLYPSYASNVLGELLESTLALIESTGIMEEHPEKGPPYEAPLQWRFGWDCEPGEFSGELTFLSATQLRISLSEVHRGEKKTKRTLLFETEMSSKVWSEMLLSNATRILRRHGLAGYRAAWINHEFPVGLYLRLLSYRKSQFRLGSAPDDFDPAERTSLSRELRLLRQEVAY